MPSPAEDLDSIGYCRLPPPLPSATIAGLGDALDRWQQHAPPPNNAYGILHNNLWQTLPAFRDTLLAGPLGPLAAELLGQPVVLFQDNLIWKTPGTTSAVQWHQDYSYWPLSAPRGVTFWLALDHIDTDNGCLRYLPQSHTLGERQPANFISPGAASWRDDLPPLDWQHREADAVDATVEAGGLLAHHPLTWHMSPPNRSQRHRRAWSLTFLTEDVCWDTAHAPHPFSYFLKPTDGQPPRGNLFPRFG